MVIGRIAQVSLLSMLVLNVEENNCRLNQKEIKKRLNNAEAVRFWHSNLPTN